MDATGCLLAQNANLVYHRFTRLQSMSEWWHWLLLIAVTAAVLVYVVIMYRRDSQELSRGVGWTLTVLRLLAFCGILFFFLDLEKRSETRQVKNSRVVMLVDTSQSMGLEDHEASGAPAGPTRIERVANELSQGPLLANLRDDHDVVVYTFDQDAQPKEIAAFPKRTRVRDGDDTELARSQQQLDDFEQARVTAGVGLALLGVAAVAFLAYLLFGRRRATAENGSWSLLASIVLTIIGLVVLAVVDLRFPDIGVLAAVGARDLPQDASSSNGEETQQMAPAEPAVNWTSQLIPRGMTSRLGDALRFLVNQERGGPISGIVVATDGGSNAGIECQLAASAAKAAGIPVYPIGLGSDRRPVNVRVVDLEAPRRVYPGDKFGMTGFVQAFGLEGRAVKVELVSAAMEQGKVVGGEEFEEEQSLKLEGDGQVTELKFEVTPESAGRRQYLLRVVPQFEDFDTRDNEKTAQVEVVERKNRVLLIAGGASREYQFLRNLLFRDRETTVDVLLQSSPEGISQEADDILTEFPGTADELFEYDCIVGFDPDWLALDELQVDLLDRWVAEKAGGLIVLAGPVNTPDWSQYRRGRDRRVDTVKGLYPVIFYSQGSATLSLGRFGGESPWPLAFTRDGLESEFLWLEDDPVDSEGAWQSFDGVFGYYAVKDPKPGARIYARFSDPDTAIDGDLPIYMAGHFYGAGRVFFQASGEMWRLRAVNEAYFERYYTKLVRWASQGRLLRDSSRGVLLVDKDRCLLGEQIVVRAILSDAQYQPLTVAEVTAVLVQPDGTRANVILRKVEDAAREGMYTGQFTALAEGDYRIELSPPGSSSEELLVRDVRVRVPALETERPERNDALLKEIADKSGGAYFVGLEAAVSRPDATRTPLVKLLVPQDQETYLPGTPDQSFDRRLMSWLMGLICGLLCIEWLIRRLSKLA